MHQARSPISDLGWAGDITEGLPMPRFIYLLGVGLALIGLALAVTAWVIGPTPGVTEANSRRIQEGMTMKEVEVILGGSGQWRWSIEEGMYETRAYDWTGAAGVVVVSSRGSWGGPRCVFESRFYRTADPIPLERLRTWLGL
jgi:hypothetical protein